MTIRLDDPARRYPAPAFAAPQTTLALARRALLGQVRVTLGEGPTLPPRDIGERASDLARRFEELRFDLVGRKLDGEQLSQEEEAILAAINAGLLASMPTPTPESDQVHAAVEEAKLLLERRRRG
ncbi:hypothetical protein DB30_07390 [Enhygromyxa salina]|uniref:Uncharacterized protein n=1 Tax=Enhygromyxa salina TaxID=215803 RepID=A0A0C1Z8M3_9BACT|nr:hypothetical protein [Enhygromyxa salina]KIG13974.1 hypothetical protein DB30_07390 [Enhygromyxa salina]